MMKEIRAVVTVILRKNGKILLFKRSDKVNTFRGYWAGISGNILDEETATHAAIRELEEETGIRAKESDLMPVKEPIKATQDDIIWKVHPFLLDISNEKISLDWENEKCEWIDPSDLHNYRIVPKLDEVIDILLRKYSKEKRKLD